MGCSNAKHMKVMNFDNVSPQVMCTEIAAGTSVTNVPQPSFHEQFIVIDKLGKGAFARVYSSVRKCDGAEFAVKVTDLRAPVKEDAVPGAERELCRRTRMMCESEIENLRAIGKQEQCISIVDSFEEGFLSYIVMERCEMTLLQGLERSNDVNESLYSKVFRDMLTALSAVHALNIAHLDVKPDNFLCNGKPRTGTVKLCDFGLAKSMTKKRSNKEVHGTAPFMAPEMLLKMGFDEKVDVWSLGVIVYVLFYGAFPYTPSDRSAKAMKVAIAQGFPKPEFALPRERHVSSSCQVSLQAESFVRQILRRDPMKRPSAKEAMEHKFLKSPKSDERQASLRPVLQAAKMVGAFTPNNCKREKEDSIDGYLFDMQARCVPPVKLDSTLFGTATTAGSSSLEQSHNGVHSSMHKGLPASSNIDCSVETSAMMRQESPKYAQNTNSHGSKGASRSLDSLPAMRVSRNHRGARPEERVSSASMVNLHDDGLRTDRILEQAMQNTLRHIQEIQQYDNMEQRVPTLPNGGPQPAAWPIRSIPVAEVAAPKRIVNQKLPKSFFNKPARVGVLPEEESVLSNSA